MLPGIADLLGPGQEPIIELPEAGDALGLGLEEEALTDEAVQPFLLASSLG